MDEETEGMWKAFERRRFLALTAAAAIMGVSATGCASKKKKKTKTPAATLSRGAGKVEKRIKKHVADKKRQKAALAQMDKAREHIKSFMRLIDESRDARIRLPPEKQVREELLAVILDYDVKIKAMLLDASELAVEMRTMITEQEWPLVFPDPAAATAEDEEKKT